MVSLKELGFQKGMIFEAIVTTSNGNTGNAAPMGIKTENMKYIIIKPYKSTQTYKNLLQNKAAVINFTHDPRIFYKTAFKKSKKEGRSFQKEMFERAATMDIPKLKGADAYLEVSVIRVEDESKDKAKFVLKICHQEVANLYFKPYCRSLFTVIESIIHATRIKEFYLQHASKDMINEADELTELVKYYQKLTERISPNSEYTRIMNKITTNIETWREAWEKHSKKIQAN